MNDPVETLATYYRKAARAGRGASRNNLALGKYLGLTLDQVRKAKRTLIDTGRLKTIGATGYLSIDGIEFSGNEGKAETPTEPLMTYLRKKFEKVCDARVVDEPEKVPRGRPREVIIGGSGLRIRTGIAFAAAVVLCAPSSRVSAA